MNTTMRALFGVVALATTILSAQGCVADRPSRNGVFDENQYIRKDFLVQPGIGGGDPGWFMKATIVQTSTPNPWANADMWTGADNEGNTLVRFDITSDKLNLLDMREMSNSADITSQNTRTPSTVNAWPITNVDLKYRVNLDGEKTNFYEENQELDWQVRQWVKINLDKNDLSDMAGLGAYQNLILEKCGDTVNSSATLVPNSFLVDETNNYMQWTVAVTVPIDPSGAVSAATDAEDCATLFGPLLTAAERIGRANVTFNVMYSFVRSTPEASGVDPTTYVPFVISEKDPIQHKYGSIQDTIFSRDTNTGLVAANQYVMRYDPNKPLVWYFAPGYPVAEQDMWTRKGGIVDQTNAIFATAKAPIRLSVLNYNDATALGDGQGPSRMYGDIRYNFIRWETDLDTDSPFLAVTQFQPDPRTGQLISASINVAGFPLKAYVEQPILAYITKAWGADASGNLRNPFSDPPPDPTSPTGTLPTSCQAGQTIPLAPANIQANIYAGSSLYQKMAQYLPPPQDGASSPGPNDYVYNHTGPAGATFFQAYDALIPFTTYADPLVNQFTSSDGTLPMGLQARMTTLSQETQFEKAMSDIDHGQGLAALQIAQSPQGMIDTYNAVDQVRQLWQGHKDFVNTWNLPYSTMREDPPTLVSFPGTLQRWSRQCITSTATPAPHWESFAEWETALLESYYQQTVWHEFGHVLGLEHNFMGSVDRNNWPQYTAQDGTTQYGMNTSSLMDYNMTADRAFWNNGTQQTNPNGTTVNTGFQSYDQAGIAWVYGNNLSTATAGPKAGMPATGQTVGASGQVSATAPWNDPIGWNSKTNAETQFLYCNAQHIHYTPLCRMFDMGSTPSEITAADIENYEWNYNYRNFRQFYKVWSAASYGATVSNFINDMRRFLAMDQWDWSPAELTDKLIQVGINAPAGAANAGLFYSQLANEFQGDVGAAEELVAAFHEGLIQQSTGQRPYQTTYDPYFGDVTQQGIAVDKEMAFINWLGLWAYDNYDPTQTAGFLGSSMVTGPGITQPSQAWSTAGSMLGEKGPWDAYPQFFPSAISLFAHDTQSPTFTGLGYPQMRDWIGGHTFTREVDVLAFFQNLALENPQGLNGCTSVATCAYNPMLPMTNAGDVGHSNTGTNAFVGPDGRRWVWVYLQDRNIWFFADQDRNSSSYYQVLTYNQDVLINYDDGNIGAVFSYDANIKYMIDAYGAWGGDTTAQ
jgi:hypothetical protein